MSAAWVLISIADGGLAAAPAVMPATFYDDIIVTVDVACFY